MTILVTGATGNIGRKVVDELLLRGVSDIRALTTNPAKANLPSGVEAFAGFIGKPETLDGAFDGVTAMYLAPYEPTAAEVLRRAKDAGVQYVVATSGSAHWQALTDIILGSGLDVTVLGPGEFLENFAGWAPGIAADSTVREPYPDAGNAPIGMIDIAAVAAALLTAEDRTPHLGRTYDITGPEFLTRPEAARQIGIGIGREVRFEQITREQAEELLRPSMGDMASWYLDLQQASIEWKQEPNDLVERLSGRPATSLAQWAAANRELFSA
ncbi:NmrA family protein OS=Tsukamurella paurometabola (strain ATCC 8368 / DSM / CCUG 35730 / CIP 100753 / JCM 10117 / KCTC 9821 / NBRC 16120 / NCIMB 702349/ NCTC 13040) OX=521096 GN=Tpau_0911 PE=4 SV=1 [Tsukamurella paurometabola]|uniref:NmrA family protein n=1 Tax=Tsukamurella paurometabola (strain ATCC 8368 / DSM 20162 / CCUG 35730 / CIP 100753 / JCM 10117 / KCTC 9821 / NBRC 16120 / NCIMB 702349 / NCTC 13040) TaxID=521096 RepID=D5UUH4_TSUPD|nr:NAD(P)H-binding protein [Tsukamurella paurometabola]ADG77545.1 NmrA family protein [Tsukamurella paurometabola DSM 20162]SUP27653.1 NAD(P)H azoreductase [Tsukamurella paurometabola]